MKLTDEELTRRAVEKVMGWEIEASACDPNSLCYLKLPDSDPRWKLHISKWQPLTDWRAAGEIVDKMRADGWTSSITIDVDCVAAFGKTHYILWKRILEAPRAITIAALLAVGAITEGQV